MFRKNYFALTLPILIGLIVGGVLLLILLTWYFLFYQKHTNYAEETSYSALVTPTESLNDEMDTLLHERTISLITNENPLVMDVENAATFKNLTVFLDGEALPLEARPFTYQTRVYLPLRQVGEALDVHVGWNSDYRTALIEHNHLRLELPVNHRKVVRFSKTAYDEAEILTIDPTSLHIGTVLYKGTTYLPIRFTAESLGYDVFFDDANDTVFFTRPSQK